MKSIETVGVLGLGKMGGPMAGHLVAKGFKVISYDPLAQAREKAIARGACSAASAREVAQASDLVIVVVGFDSEVEEVVFGKEGVLEGAGPGLIVALGSTVAPRYSKRVAARLGERGIVLLDIPLARGEAAAVAGKLLVYGAGDHAVFEHCKPVFSAFASDIFHLGPAGAGQVAKMVNNLILWACIAVNDEGLRLGQALGVDPQLLCQALHHGSAQNWAMDTQAERSGMPWAEKDMSIVLQEADAARLSLPLAGTVKEAIKGLKIRLGLGMPEVGGHD
ncbi:MAG TPA: NAD(P)-dependent oxidoreductase [Burkholderiales bacterium]|nr:NAD(P)-dependent oxidoreductase [Burkholderiales bacterium]